MRAFAATAATAAADGRATPAEATTSVSGLGLFTTDRQLIVRTWDAWLESASGIAAADAIGRAVTDVIPDLDSRGLLVRFHAAVTTGTVHVLAPAFHHYLIRCRTLQASPYFSEMQQRVTIGPLRDPHEITGAIVAIEDVTARLDEERRLADALRSADPETRREASAAVAAAASIERPAAFAPALQDDNWRVRQTAVETLAGRDDAHVVLSVIESIRRDHRHFGLLSSALKLLARTEVDVTEPLAALLRDPDPDLRIQAALALGEQHDARATAALVAALDDEHVNVRFQAIESLGRLRAEAAVDPLLAIVDSRDFFLAFPALDALAAIGDARIAPDLVPLLDDDQLRVPVADALAIVGDDRAVRPLVAALNRSGAATLSIAAAIVQIHDRFERHYADGVRISDLVRSGLDRDGRRHLLTALSSATSDQLPSLVRLLGWLDGADVVEALTRFLGDAAVRSEVIEALVRHGETVVDALVGQLEAEDDSTRRAAVVALGRLGSRRATARLVAMLSDDEPLLVPVAGALARIGDPAASAALLPLLGHPDGAVRQAVIGALNSIGHQDLPREVARLLADPQPLVRESAVRIAGYFGYRETVDRMLALADDPEELVRAAVVEHLAFVDDPRATPQLLAALAGDSAKTRAAAARALGKSDSGEAVPALVEALYDADPWVRYYAVRALAEQRPAAALDPLLRLARADAAPHVRIAALDVVGAIGGAGAVEAVRALAGDPHSEVAAAALAALGRFAAADAVSELQEALRSGDTPRRLAAIRGLAAQAGESAVGALEWTALADDDASVTAAAIAALESIAAAETPAGTAAVQSLCGMLGDAGRRDAAAAALARLPVSRLPDVAHALHHPSVDVRAAAVDMLGRCQHAEATALVIRALDDAAAAVRESAVTTLMRLGARGLDARFSSLAAQDPSKRVRRAAAAALASVRSGPV
jgi:HEAT repeat protein